MKYHIFTLGRVWAQAFDIKGSVGLKELFKILHVAISNTYSNDTHCTVTQRADHQISHRATSRENSTFFQMIVERQVMAENKPEFVFASCQLVNVWAQKMTADERIMFVTEVNTSRWF